jgi:hypothetical protein
MHFAYRDLRKCNFLASRINLGILIVNKKGEPFLVRLFNF